MGKKIVVFTTFRDFDGKTNDKIQRFFLESVKNQTYKNFILAVTIFGEKGVPEALTESGLPHVIYYDHSNEYKFSWSQTMLNGIDATKKYLEECILIWANGDTILQPDYLERVSKCYTSKMAGISYPQTQYRSIDAYQNKNGGIYAWYGFDGAFFSSDVFNERCVETLKKYMINDYLYFELFLAGVLTVFADNLVNLWPGKFSTIVNDYAAVNQTYQSTKISGLKNLPKLKAFVKEFNLSDKDYYNWILNFKITDNSPKAIWMRIRIYIQVKYMSSYIRRAMPKIKRLIGLSK